MPLQLEIDQRQLCRKHRVDYVSADGSVNSGFATQTLGLVPLNGIRHPSTEDTTGWYVWCGEFSRDDDFFKPVHTEHLYEQFPEAAALFGLPPGFRFLQAGDDLDVWFDPSLLSDEASK